MNGKVAIVTGGASGIGLASAEMFVAEGASVVIADIDDDAGRAAAARLGDAATYAHADVTADDQVADLISVAVEHFGKLDVMFNNAAAVGARDTLVDISTHDLTKVLELVAVSVALGHRYAAEQFRKQGSGGSIVSTVSVAGLQAGWGAPAYTIAKHAVVGIIRQASAELGREHIRSNGVAPGAVLTQIQARSYGVPLDRATEFNSFLDEEVGVRQPMARFGTPEDIAGAVTFLASDLSAYVNGVVIPVDGGATAAAQTSYVPDVKAATARFLGV